MSVDVDAVNERLNGLVTLLKAVGVDSLEKGEVASNKMGSSNGNNDLALPDARQLNDDQIEAIIKKLQQAQSEAPQIIAALEAHAEARSLTGSAAAPKQQQKPKQPEPEEEEDDDEDEFDEDANYPMVGAGVSDDISVVSDLTTPTVLEGVHVPEEEHYRDTLPPMIVGGGPGNGPGMVISAPKRKNLVNQVRPGGIAPPGSRRNDRVRPGGAAAARRKNYQDTMAKLHENPTNMGYVGPPEVPANAHKQAPRKSRPAGGERSGSGKRRPTKSRSADGDAFGSTHSNRSGNSGDWDTGFSGGNKPKPKPKSKPTKQIDDDGFLVGDSFDPFNTGGGSGVGGASSNPFRSTAGDLQGARDPFSSNASASGFEETRSNPRKSGSKKKPPEQRMQSKFSSGGERERKQRPSSSSNGAAGGRRRARRASLAM